MFNLNIIFKVIVTLFVLIHGLIHLFGFFKAFNFAEIPQLKNEIGPFAGIMWLVSGLTLIIVAITIWIYPDKMWLFGILAIAFSQIMIFTFWQDAKFGTIANIIILIISVLSYGNYRFETEYKNDVQKKIEITNFSPEDVVTDNDLVDLPLPVQRYLRYAGVVNKPKIKNMRAVFEGELRDKGKDWFKFRSVQYNFFDDPTRLFFIKGRMFGLNVPGYHKFASCNASMDIRLFGLFPVVQYSGGVMNKTETVTYFNDLCLMAPAALIDKRIRWESIDEKTVKAKFINGDNEITATLYFDTDGKLINFLSYDRTSISEMKQFPFSTPVKKYGIYNGYHIAAEGDAVWHYPEGQFVYGKFRLKEIDYNVSTLK